MTTKNEQKNDDAKPLRQPCVVRAQALVHRLEYGGLIFAKNAKFNMEADKAEALEKLGKIKIIGA